MGLRRFFSDKYKVRRLGRDFSIIGFFIAMTSVVSFLYGLGEKRSKNKK
jgi:hypothetical protein